MSKQRKLRNKLSFDEHEEGEDNPPPPPPSASVKPKKDGSSKSKKSALLSFGDDDDSELAVSKSKKDKVKVSKFHRANIPAPLTAAAAPSMQPSAGEYTAEKLAALQAATQKLPSSYKPPPTPAAADETAAAIAAAAAAGGTAGGAGIKLSGSFKPAAAPKDDRFSYTYSIHGHIKSSKDQQLAAAAAAVGQLSTDVAAAKISDKADDNSDDDEAMPLPPPPRPRAAAAAVNGAAAAAAAGDDEDNDHDGADDSFLPDEETIRLAKAKRERLRQAHLAPDYVPLGGASRLLGAGGLGGRSSSKGSAARSDQGAAAAADHDQEDLGSGSDHEGLGEGSDAEGDLEDTYRMKFVGQQASAAGRKRGSSSSSRRAAAAAASGQYATEVQDQEDDEIHDVIGSTAAASGEDPLLRAIRRNAGGGRAAAAAVGGSSSSWLAGSSRGVSSRMDMIKAAGAGVVEALLEASSRAAGRQKHLQGNLNRTAANLTGAVEEAERIRADIAAASAKYAAVQSLKAYLSDLADCLAVKAPLVEELQESLDAAREEAAAAVRQQQQEDELILYAQAEAAVAAALTVLGNGGTSAAAAAAAETAAADAHEAAVAAAAAASGSQDKDEFGRDLGLWKRKELERGKTRRDGLVAALLQEVQQLREGGQLNLEEDNVAAAAAASSTAAAAAEPEAVQQYRRRRQEILDLAPTVFADTDEQYSSLRSVQTKLEGFKAKYPKEYNTAYIGDSAAALFAPFVRLELLHWEPLPISSSSTEAAAAAAAAAGGDQQQQQQQQGDGSSPGFDSQGWYQQLFEYGLNAGDNAAGDDADANLVPQLVESLILPQALHLVAKCWDPCQVAQSKAVVSLVADLFVYVAADNEDMAQLLALTTGSLEAAAAAAIVPPWPTAAAAASPVAQAVLQLRFRRCAALLRGLLGFKELLSQQLLFQLALQGLVGQQLVPCLRSCLGDLGLAVGRVEAVVQSLPGSWFKVGLRPRELQPLLDVLGSLGRSVEQQLQKSGEIGRGGAHSGLSYAALGRRVAALLSYVGLMEQAQSLGRLLG